MDLSHKNFNENSRQPNINQMQRMIKINPFRPNAKIKMKQIEQCDLC